MIPPTALSGQQRGKSLNACPSIDYSLNEVNTVREKVATLVGRLIKLIKKSAISVARLKNLIDRLPKGAAVHNHLSGSVNLEHLCFWIVKNNLVFDNKQRIFVKKNKFLSLISKEESQDCWSLISAKGLKLATMVECRGLQGIEAQVQFFQENFKVIESILKHVPLEEQLKTFLSGIYLQNIQHVEIMHEGCEKPTREEDKFLTRFEERFKPFKSKSLSNIDRKQIEELCNVLFKRLWPALERNATVKARVQEYKECEERCGEVFASAFGTVPLTDPRSPVSVVIIRELDRCKERVSEFFLDAMRAHHLIIKCHPFVRGLSPVGSEMSPLAQHHFQIQMVMLRWLKERLEYPHLSIHAGEFSTDRPSAVAHNRIWDSLEANPTRLSHALGLAENDDMHLLLLNLKKLAIEIALSSNSELSGCDSKARSFKDHPFKDYRAAGVPCILITDDPGIFVTDMSREFLKACLEYNLNYFDCIQLIRNSLIFSFLPTGPEPRLVYIDEKDEIQIDRLSAQMKLESIYIDVGGLWCVNPDLEQIVYQDEAPSSDSPKILRMIQFERLLAQFERDEVDSLTSYINEVKITNSPPKRSHHSKKSRRIRTEA